MAFGSSLAGLGLTDEACHGCCLLRFMALAVGSFTAVAFTVAASSPEDSHTLVQAGVGFAEAHGAVHFCNKCKQNSRVRHGDRVVIVQTHICQEKILKRQQLNVPKVRRCQLGRAGWEAHRHSRGHNPTALVVHGGQTPLCLTWRRGRMALLDVLI